MNSDERNNITTIYGKLSILASSVLNENSSSRNVVAPNYSTSKGVVKPSAVTNFQDRLLYNKFVTKIKGSTKDYVGDQNLTEDSHGFHQNVYNSSSSEDDECCVYTYKGAEIDSDHDELIDLQGSNRNKVRTSACSSPDFDFLEMDFDPGPSNGQDSDGDGFLSDEVVSLNPSHTHTNELHLAFTEYVKFSEKETLLDENANCNLDKVINIDCENLRSDDRGPCCSKTLCSDEVRHEIKSDQILSQRCVISPKLFKDVICGVDLVPDIGTQKESGDSDRVDLTFISNGSDQTTFKNENEVGLEKSFVTCLIDEDDLINFEELLSVDPSCSISAIINVAKVLNIQRDSNEREELQNLLRPKQISESTPLVEYLFMRATQNVNEIDVANYASLVFKKKLHFRFFSTYMKSQFKLIEWLHSWMRKGAVPIVLRNIQEKGILATKNIIRNPWRHNVVYKLDSHHIYLSNPAEKVPSYLLMSQLSQPSLIYVKRNCILQKWNAEVDLRPLVRANNNRWYNENVLGQVAAVIRENVTGNSSTQYVRIPSNCHCGISLVAPSENHTLCQEIDEEEELPTLLEGISSQILLNR